MAKTTTTTTTTLTQGSIKRASFEQDDGGEQISESCSFSTRGEQRAASQGLADDEMSPGADDDDDDGDEDTFNAHLQMDNMSDPLRKSMSPSRLDGRDIFQDLSEMSNCADRIDSILEQSVSEHSTRSGSQLGARTSGSTRPRSVSPSMGNEYQQAAGMVPNSDDEYDDDDEDRNEEVD